MNNNEITKIKEEMKNDQSLRSIDFNGIATYDIEVYKTKLAEAPTLEKFNNLFSNINNWNTTIESKNRARALLIEYWNIINN